MIQLPEYTDGCLAIYRIKQDTGQDFPKTYIEDMNLRVWYREISVFDRVKHEFDQGGKEVTMKVRIPKFKGIDSECVCVIDGKQHLVYNAAHVKDKNGIDETELTLIRPKGVYQKV